MKKLVLIDGNAIIHRAYHALPKTMMTRSGELTNAVYGFTTTLIKVLQDLRPAYIAASFDLAGPTFRHEHFADYKATRVKADQELYDQIPKVKEIVEVMEIPIYERQGFEADDCLGTIVAKMTQSSPNSRGSTNSLVDSHLRGNDKKGSGNNDIEIYIVSGDKDIYQLIDGSVKVYSLRKGLSQMQIVDHDTIRKEYDLQPSDFIDLKALAGDPSDNIPGVPGIGPKTATDLIQKYDTLEGLYKNLDSADVKPRIKELLKTHKDQAFMSQKLATIHRDVPIEFDLEKCRWGEYDRENLRKLFEELGFNSLLRRFDTGGEKSKIQSPNDKSIPKSVVQKNDKQLKLL